MSMSAALVFYIIIIVFVFIGVDIKKTRNRSSQTNTQKPFQQKTQTYNRPANPMYNKQKNLTEKDIFNSQKKSFHLFNSGHEIDCGLDERIFGPRNQHKDIF